MMINEPRTRMIKGIMTNLGDYVTPPSARPAYFAKYFASGLLHRAPLAVYLRGFVGGPSCGLERVGAFFDTKHNKKWTVRVFFFVVSTPFTVSAPHSCSHSDSR